MLEKLNSINWSDYTHAYGLASDVPSLLLGLMSEDKDKRDRNFETLANFVCHQGQVYEAALPTAEVLVEMLSKNLAPDVTLIFALFEMMSEGAYWFYPDTDEGIRQLIADQVDLLLPYLDSEHDLVRSEVLYFFCNAPRIHASDSFKVLKSVWKRVIEEENQAIKRQAILGIGYLFGGYYRPHLSSIQASIIAELRQLLEQDKSYEMQIALAATLTRLLQEETEERIVNILIETIANPIRGENGLPIDIAPKTPWVTITSRSALWHIGLARAVHALAVATEQGDYQRDKNCITMVAWAIRESREYRGDRQNLSLTGLNELQIFAVRTYYRYEKNLETLTEIFKRFGLITNPHELEQFFA